jgi:hypothetical protein
MSLIERVLGYRKRAIAMERVAQSAEDKRAAQEASVAARALCDKFDEYAEGFKRSKSMCMFYHVYAPPNCTASAVKAEIAEMLELGDRGTLEVTIDPPAPLEAEVITGISSWIFAANLTMAK